MSSIPPKKSTQSTKTTKKDISSTEAAKKSTQTTKTTKREVPTSDETKKLTQSVRSTKKEVSTTESTKKTIQTAKSPVKKTSTLGTPTKLISRKKTPTKEVSSDLTPEQELLKELEVLSLQDRYKRIIEVGRAARDGKEESEEYHLLLKLSKSNIPYERMIGALGLWQSDINTEITRLINDACDFVATLAMTPAATKLNDNEIHQLFKEIPFWRLHQLCKRLEHAGRIPAIVDNYISNLSPEEISWRKNSRIQPLLSWASESILTEQPVTVLRMFNKKEWFALTRRIPDFVMDFVLKELNNEKGAKESSTTSRASPITIFTVSKESVNRIHIVLEALLRYYPSHGLKLLTNVLDSIEVKEDCLIKYAQLYPSEVANLVLKYKIQVSLECSSIMKRLDADILFELFNADALPYCSPVVFFTKAPVKIRDKLYSKFSKSMLESNGAMKISALKCITDSKQRESEAMHALTEVEELRISPLVYIEYISVLSFPKAIEIGSQYLRSQKIDIRAAACAAVIKTGRYHTNHLEDILQFCISRNNESDIVRRAIICELSELPPTRWKDEHFDNFIKIIQSVCDAKDASCETYYYAITLIIKSALVSSKLIENSLLKIIKCANMAVPSMELYAFSKSMVENIWNTLLPWMKSERDTGNDYILSSTISSFGKHLLKISDNAIDFLKSMRNSPHSSIAQSGITILFQYFPSIAKEMIPSLLSASSDWITLDFIKNYVGQSLQGKILDRYITPIKMSGMLTFSKEETLVTFNNAFYWTSEKQKIYAKSIVNYLLKKDHNIWDERKMLHILPSLHSGNVSEALLPFLKEECENIRLRDMIIENFGRFNDNTSFEILINSLESSDDRARVAIYAIIRRLRGLPISQIIKILYNSAYSQKVTLQKIAIRIIGETAEEEAYNFLKELRQNKSSLHDSVEISWLNAMFKFLSKEEVWDELEAAAKSIKCDVASTLAYIPNESFQEDWQHKRLEKIILTLLSHNNITVVYAVMKRLSISPLLYHDTEVIESLFQCLQTRRDVEFITEVIRALASSSASSSDIAKCIASVQEESKLGYIIKLFPTLSRTFQKRFECITVALVKVLIQSRRQPSLACQLICELPAVLQGDLLKDIFSKGLLHPGAANIMVQCIECNLKNEENFIELEKWLRHHEHPYLQRIGLALLCKMAKSPTSLKNWTPELLEALQFYRNCSDPWVSDDANLVDTQM